MEQLLSYVIFLTPLLVVAIGAALALAGFAPWLWRHPERWLFWVILAITFGPATGDPSADGSIVRQITWGVLFVLVAALLTFDQNKPDKPLSNMLPNSLIVLFAWLLISVAWSSAPFISLKRVIQAVGVLLIGILVARDTLKGHASLQQIQTPAMVLIWVGLLVAVAAPSIAFDADHGFRGVSSHKNVWGGFSLIAGLAFLLGWLANPKRKFMLVFGLVPAIISLVMSHSTTSLLSFIVVCAAIVAWMFAKHSGTAGQMALLACIMLLSLLFLGYLVVTGDWPLDALTDLIFQATGKDQSLTGRKFLWDLMFAEIAKHPWMGAGYGGFWTNGPGDSAVLVSKLNWGPPTQAHSGYIDITNELGIVGLAAFCVVILTHLVRIVKLMKRDKSNVGMFHAAILFSVLISNYAESSLLRTTHIWWIMVCTSIIEVYVLTIAADTKVHDAQKARANFRQ